MRNPAPPTPAEPVLPATDPMSRAHPFDREEINRQASVWTARLETGALDDDGRRELDAWLDADPEHREALSRYREMCAQLAEQVPVLADPEEVDALVARVATRHRWRRGATRVFATAAAVALAAGLWGMLPDKMETRSAERRAVALPDGSRLELNAQTSLGVSLARGERRVKLARGEALFRVAHDPARPFFVETPAGTVRVTGTVFNVRESSSDHFEVTVLEGSVQVRAAAHTPAASVPLPLAVGEQARVGAAGIAVQTLSPEAVQNVIAWRVGQAAFESEPLAGAFERFAAYHARKITVSPEAAILRVGGRYSLDDLDGFLAAVEQALPVGVIHGAEGAVQIVARPRTPR